MKTLIISCSLKGYSRSRIMADAAHRHLQNQGADVELIDLRDYPLPLCDGESAYGDPNTVVLAQKTEEASAFILACPIYNFYGNAAAKNLIELTGRNWEGKVAGFICAAGGSMSYMSILSLANSLMLDFRVTIVPRFVYATGAAFEADRITDEEVDRRVKELAETVIWTAQRLAA